MRLRSEALAALAVILLFATGTAPSVGAAVPPGDDIILTDGRTISGTIVGMEKGSFRVETDFGIALIRKDKVARIEVSKSAASSPAASAKPPEKAIIKPPPPPLKPTIQERRPPSGHMEDHVDGITYFNDSFGFQMYKPPNWKPLPEAAATIPSAVVVLGTEDEATVMIVGTVLFDGPPSA